MKVAKSDCGLKCIIVGCADAVELNNGAEIRERIVLVDVGDNIQLSCLTANIPNLHNCCLAKSFLELQIVISEVGHTEVLVYRKDILSWSVRAQRIATHLYSGKDGGSTGQRSIPVVGISGVRRNSGRSDRISLQTLRGSDRWTEIQEWIHVDLIEEDANSATHDEVARTRGLIRKAQPRRKVVVARRKNGIDPSSLDE